MYMHNTFRFVTESAASGTQAAVTEAVVIAGVTLKEYFAWSEESLTLAALDEAFTPFYLLPRYVLYYLVQMSGSCCRQCDSTA
jgi:hypothetical protein